MKTCTGCGVEKPLSEFNKQRSNKDGLQYVCKACNAAKSREYKSKNYDKVLAMHAAYRATHGDEIAEYRKENAEHLRASRRAYYRENVDAEKARAREYRAANSQPIAEYMAKYREENADDIKTWRLRKFGITIQEFRDKVESCGGRCPICLAEFGTGHESMPCVDHSHTREPVVGARHSMRGVVCRACNLTRVAKADIYLKKLGILDTDPGAFPALLKRRVSFAENVAKHVTGSWIPEEEK